MDLFSPIIEIYLSDSFAHVRYLTWAKSLSYMGRSGRKSYLTWAKSLSYMGRNGRLELGVPKNTHVACRALSSREITQNVLKEEL